MPDKGTVAKAKRDLKEGKSPTTAAGEFVHQEIDHVREGKHGARSAKQAIAIGLSEARRAGIPVKPPSKGRTSESTRKKAERDYEQGQKSPKTHSGSSPRSRARSRALKRESKSSASHSALSRQAKSAARRRRSSSSR